MVTTRNGGCRRSTGPSGGSAATRRASSSSVAATWSRYEAPIVYHSRSRNSGLCRGPPKSPSRKARATWKMLPEPAAISRFIHSSGDGARKRGTDAPAAGWNSVRENLDGRLGDQVRREARGVHLDVAAFREEGADLAGESLGALEARAQVGRHGREYAARVRGGKAAPRRVPGWTSPVPVRIVGPVKAATIHGFRQVDERAVDEYRCRARVFRHAATGCEVLHLATADTENLFAFSFATPALDDTGSAHILEHSVLAGSAPLPAARAVHRADARQRVHLPERLHVPRPHRLPGRELHAEGLLQPPRRVRRRGVLPPAARRDLPPGGLAPRGGRRPARARGGGVQRDERRVRQPRGRGGRVGTARALPRHAARPGLRRRSPGHPRRSPRRPARLPPALVPPLQLPDLPVRRQPVEATLAFLQERFLASFAAEPIDATLPTDPAPWTAPARLERTLHRPRRNPDGTAQHGGHELARPVGGRPRGAARARGALRRARRLARIPAVEGARGIGPRRGRGARHGARDRGRARGLRGRPARHRPRPGRRGRAARARHPREPREERGIGDAGRGRHAQPRGVPQPRDPGRRAAPTRCASCGACSAAGRRARTRSTASCSPR